MFQRALESIILEDTLTFILESDSNGDFVIDTEEVEEVVHYLKIMCDEFNEQDFRTKYESSDKSIETIVLIVALSLDNNSKSFTPPMPNLGLAYSKISVR